MCVCVCLYLEGGGERVGRVHYIIKAQSLFVRDKLKTKNENSEKRIKQKQDIKDGISYLPNWVMGKKTHVGVVQRDLQCLDARISAVLATSSRSQPSNPQFSTFFFRISCHCSVVFVGYLPFPIGCRLLQCELGFFLSRFWNSSVRFDG